MTTSRTIVRRRSLVICGIIWLPLLVLCAIEGTLMGGIDIPFLVDVETHARFLVAVPLMILAELLVHQRMRGIVAQFVERKLVPAGVAGAVPRGDRAARWPGATRSPPSWRSSRIVFPLGYYIRTDVFALQASTWYATVGAGGVGAHRSPGSGSPG